MRLSSRASREHYGICRYKTLVAGAEEFVVRLLTSNPKEENAADTKLNTVAMRRGVNVKAWNAA